MRIAIIGGGFYGCYIATEIERKFNADVEVFDKNEDLMLEAATNNQSRLHLGFHYPRSPLTIQQTINGFHHFVERFSRFITFPKTNIYAIHKDSLIPFNEYIKPFDEYHIYYELFEGDLGQYFKNPKDIEKAIVVGEGVIDLAALREYLLKKIKKKHLRCKINSVEELKDYDWIINTTYTNPNLGIPPIFDLKYELACLVVIKPPFPKNVGITIMDGEFISLYPATENTATISSVKYTPYAKFSTLEEISDIKHKACENIINHVQQYLKIKPVVQGLKLSTKCKLKDDIGDTRETQVVQYGKVLSVLCGKLDAVNSAAEKIIQLIS